MIRKKLIEAMIENYEQEIIVLQGCISTLETEKIKLIIKEGRDAQAHKSVGDKT